MSAPETLLDAVRDLFVGEQRGYYDLPKSAFVEAVHVAYVRERLATDTKPDLLAALQALASAPTVPVHDGYDAGGNYTWVDAVRVDEDAFIAARAAIAKATDA